MTISLFWKVTPLYIVIGALLAMPLLQNVAQASTISRAKSDAVHQLEKKPTAPQVQGIPSTILLPSIQINLPVIPQTYSLKSNTWQVDPTTANYATNTVPNNTLSGKTLLYGHGTLPVFEKTGQLHLGDVAYIKTTNGHIFKYLFSGNFSIAYNDTSIFDKLSGKPGLYLMTCDGVWNQFRRISTFTLESES